MSSKLKTIIFAKNHIETRMPLTAGELNFINVYMVDKANETKTKHYYLRIINGELTLSESLIDETKGEQNESI